MTDALTDSPFRHAASATLKHILEKESRHITRADLEQRCIGLSNLSATMLSAIAFRPRFLKHEPKQRRTRWTPSIAGTTSVAATTCESSGLANPRPVACAFKTSAVFFITPRSPRASCLRPPAPISPLGACHALPTSRRPVLCISLARCPSSPRHPSFWPRAWMTACLPEPLSPEDRQPTFRGPLRARSLPPQTNDARPRFSDRPVPAHVR